MKLRITGMLIPLLLAGSLLLGGCNKGHPFEFLESGYALKGSTIAVVSGSTDEATERFAQHLTRSLQKESTLKVLSQNQVARRIGKYPVDIKTTDPRDWDRPVWYPSKDKARVESIARHTGTDYVLFVWVDSINRVTTTYSQGGASVDYTVTIIGNLVDRRGRPVGFSNYGASKGQSCCLFGISEGKDIDSLLQQAADKAAVKFAQRTGTEKP